MQAWTDSVEDSEGIVVAVSQFSFDVVMDVVTEVVAKKGCAVMYADDILLICETKGEARQRFVSWRNMLESKGLNVNISKMKVCT